MHGARFGAQRAADGVVTLPSATAIDKMHKTVVVDLLAGAQALDNLPPFLQIARQQAIYFYFRRLDIALAVVLVKEAQSVDIRRRCLRQELLF